MLDKTSEKQELHNSPDSGSGSTKHGKTRNTLLGSVQGQAGWGFEQAGLVEGVPVHGRGVRTR